MHKPVRRGQDARKDAREGSKEEGTCRSHSICGHARRVVDRRRVRHIQGQPPLQRGCRVFSQGRLCFPEEGERPCRQQRSGRGGKS